MNLYLRRNGSRMILFMYVTRKTVYTFIVSNCIAHSASMGMRYRRASHYYYYYFQLCHIFLSKEFNKLFLGSNTITIKFLFLRSNISLLNVYEFTHGTSIHIFGSLLTLGLYSSNKIGLYKELHARTNNVTTSSVILCAQLHRLSLANWF